MSNIVSNTIQNADASEQIEPAVLAYHAELAGFRYGVALVDYMRARADGDCSEFKLKRKMEPLKEVVDELSRASLSPHGSKRNAAIAKWVREQEAPEGVKA